MGLFTNSSRASSGPRCGNCGYNLTAATSNRCPECGLLFIEAGVIVPHRRGRRRVAVYVLLGAALVLLPLLLLTTITLYARARAAAERAAAERARAAAVEAFFNQEADARNELLRARREQILNNPHLRAVDEELSRP
jgi:hypothetical protein